MLVTMRKVLLAVDFRNRFPMGRKVTIGEVAKTAKMSRSTVRRYLIKACGLGMVQTHSFKRGGKTCYEFEIDAEGKLFVDSFLELGF